MFIKQALIGKCLDAECDLEPKRVLESPGEVIDNKQLLCTKDPKHLMKWDIAVFVSELPLGGIEQWITAN